jgi:hypothetical protein
MPYQRYAVTHQKLELRSKALAANIEEIRHLKEPLARLDALLVLLRELTAEQARLTALRQEVSKQIADLTDEAQKLMTFLDVGIRQHYGNRSEKLVEYGLRPFRSKPRARRAGSNGKPLKRNAAEAETPESLDVP